MPRKTSSQPGSDTQPMREQPAAPEQIFTRCCQLLKQGDPAARQLLPRLERFPNCHDGWLLLGETLLGLAQFDGANVAFGYALTAQPTSLRALLGKGEALMSLNEATRAARLLEANRAHWANSASVAHALGRAHYAAGVWQASQAALERAVTLDPGLAGAWFRLGLVEQNLHRPAAATEAYRRALEARPGMYEAALNLGISLQDTGDIDAAMRAYGTAVRTAPACFNRVAQALTSASNGRLWLDLSALRRVLDTYT